MKPVSKNMFMRFAMATLVVACIISIVAFRINNNEKKLKAEELKSQISDVSERINELQYYLDEPFNEQYVSKIAREKLGLRYPHEIVFYSNDGNK